MNTQETAAEFAARLNLGSGRIVGCSQRPGCDAREFTPVATPELEQELKAANIHYRRDRADNREHPDCGKPILIFTLWV